MSDSTTQPPDSNMDVNEELDPTVEEEINRDATQADAMNIDGAADAEPAAVNGITDTAQTFEARIPAKKDATLREFLGKMDEYAPIVCQPLVCVSRQYGLTRCLDTRRGDQLLSHTCRPATATPDLTPPSPPPCACDPEVHSRHRSRRLSVLPYKIVKHYEQQPHGRCRWITRCSSTRRSTGWQGRRFQSERLQFRHPAPRVWWWWTRW
jgi:hypothetical protein